MAFRVEIARQAAVDLEHIFDFIRAQSSDAAADWINGLVKVIESLAHLPNRGHPLDKVRRQIFYGNRPHTHRIVYLVDVKINTVLVLYIRHGAQLHNPQSCK